MRLKCKDCDDYLGVRVDIDNVFYRVHFDKDGYIELDPDDEPMNREVFHNKNQYHTYRVQAFLEAQGDNPNPKDFYCCDCGEEGTIVFE